MIIIVIIFNNLTQSSGGFKRAHYTSEILVFVFENNEKI